MAIVICKLPKAGLGNLLFPIMRAHVFARLNNLDIIVTGYHRVKLGPFLRMEKSKRKYSGYFRFQKNWIGEMLDKRRLRKLDPAVLITDPPVQVMEVQSDENKTYLFSRLPDFWDFFAGLNPYRILVKDIFWELIHPRIKKKLEGKKAPCIGVHIRMGDFTKLKPGEDLSERGQVRTPEEYFINTIKNIREIHGSALPVTVFTDGYRHEFEHLFSLENISLSEGNPDIVDLILLSRSQVIVVATGSTFSYWAGFLSDAAVILHPAHIYKPNRLPTDVPALYEGPFDRNNSLLVNSIRKIGALKTVPA